MERVVRHPSKLLQIFGIEDFGCGAPRVSRESPRYTFTAPWLERRASLGQAAFAKITSRETEPYRIENIWIEKNSIRRNQRLSIMRRRFPGSPF
jgi:hypothetical protein